MRKKTDQRTQPKFHGTAYYQQAPDVSQPMRRFQPHRPNHNRCFGWLILFFHLFKVSLALLCPPHKKKAVFVPGNVEDILIARKRSESRANHGLSWMQSTKKRSSTKEFFADDKDTMKWRHDIEKSFKNKKVSSWRRIFWSKRNSQLPPASRAFH